MNETAIRIKELRSRKGYSQEELAEKSGLSLRTIQRIENGETMPRGDSLTRLAAAFDVTVDDLADWGVTENNRIALKMHLWAMSPLLLPITIVSIVPLLSSSLSSDELTIWLMTFWGVSFFLFPLFGVVVPLMIWLSQKGKVKGLDAAARGLLNFQSTWTVIYFIGNFLFFIIIPTTTFGNDLGFFGVMVWCLVMYTYNLAMIFINAARVWNGRSVIYWPNIPFIGR